MAAPKKRPTESEEGAGTISSSFNPKYLTISDGRIIPNPFYEPLPRPEVWHRNVPSALPFGETPYMANLMSQQIDADLGNTQRSQIPKASKDSTSKQNLQDGRPKYGKLPCRQVHQSQESRNVDDKSEMIIEETQEKVSEKKVLKKKAEEVVESMVKQDESG